MTNENDETDLNMDVVQQQLEGLKPKQLEELASLVNGKVEEHDIERKKNTPQLGRMDGPEFRDYVRKNLGIDPGV